MDPEKYSDAQTSGFLLLRDSLPRIYHPHRLPRGDLTERRPKQVENM